MGQCDEQKVAEEKVVVNDKFFYFSKQIDERCISEIIYIYSISFGIEGLT